MIVTVEGKSYIVRFSKDIKEREKKVLDKFHRKVTITWDELTVECTVCEVFKRKLVNKLQQFTGIATASYTDVMSVPYGRFLALYRALSLMGLNKDEEALFYKAVSGQVKLCYNTYRKVPPKAYADISFVAPKPKKETKEERMNERLARKAERDKQRNAVKDPEAEGIRIRYVEKKTPPEVV